MAMRSALQISHDFKDILLESDAIEPTREDATDSLVNVRSEAVNENAKNKKTDGYDDGDVVDYHLFACALLSFGDRAAHSLLALLKELLITIGATLGGSLSWGGHGSILLD